MTVESKARPIGAQATVYALSDYFDLAGFDGDFVQSGSGVKSEQPNLV